MKRTLFLFCLLACDMISAFSQNTLTVEDADSTIDCVAFFLKGDTVVYELTEQEFRLSNNLKDTIFTVDATTGVQLAVLDSTEKGYRIELSYTSYKNNLENDTSLYALMANAIKPSILGMKVVFTTDELGTFQHIENWRELRDSLKVAYGKAIDALYSKDIKAPITMPRSRLESLFYTQVATEKAVKANFDEIDLLFSNYGNRFTIGKVSDDDSPTGYKQHNETYAGYIPQSDTINYEFNGDYFLGYTNKLTIPGEDVKQMGLSFMGLVADVDSSRMDSIKQATNTLLDGTDAVVFSSEEGVYWPNGWPKSVKTSDYTIIGDDKVVKGKMEYIEWTERNWYYDDGKETDESQEL